MESRNPRGGKVIDRIGHYNPYVSDKPLVIDFDKVDYWKEKGALPSEAVIKLLRRGRKIAAGTLPEKAVPKKKVKAVEPVVEEAAVEETPTEEAAVEAPVEETPAEEPVEEAAAETKTEEPAAETETEKPSE